MGVCVSGSEDVRNSYCNRGYIVVYLTSYKMDSNTYPMHTLHVVCSIIQLWTYIVDDLYLHTGG